MYGGSSQANYKNCLKLNSALHDHDIIVLLFIIPWYDDDHEKQEKDHINK